LQRWLNPNFKKAVGKLTQTGYAVPGAIIAIGTIMAFVSIDSTLYPLYKLIDPSTKKLVLSTSTIMLLFAFVIRYMSIGYNTVNSGFSKIGTGFNDAARIMGKTPGRALLQVEIPMMLNSLASGFLLVFIDIMKELPLTLLLRPFNFNTLASRAYEYANDERILESSIPSLLIIVICMVSIAVFVAINRKSRKGDKFDVEN
jgi:iron(III) transport system permease protein